MSVLEPFVLGLAITELTRNVLNIAKGVEGASINTTYVFGVMALYLCVVCSMKLGLTILIIL